MSRSQMAIGLVPVALVMFAIGYRLLDHFEAQRIWHEDRNLKESLPSQRSADEPERARPIISPLLFEDVAPERGLDFTYYDGAEGQLWIMESTGGGMAVIDFDGDGRQDIYMVNGSRLPTDANDRSHSAQLFRNGADAGFEALGAFAAVDLVAYGQGAASGDYDNDGFDDILVTTYARNVLYHNNGDGTFRDVTCQSGAETDRWGTSAAFSDLNGDGALDLYVCTYADVSLEHPELCTQHGTPVHCGPLKYPAQADLLYFNSGDGRFQERAGQAGIEDRNGRGLALAIADLNGDHRPDVFVANDTSENLLFINRGDDEFEERALDSGVALTGTGSTMQGMGVACADYDLNGTPDLFVTDFYGEKNVLFHNMGSAMFVDRADRAGLAAPSRDRLAFGTVFIDADLDGYPDLFVANGHVDDLSAHGIPFRMRQQLFHNRADGTFQDVSSSAGAYFRRLLLGRAVASLDADNNGLPDLVVSHIAAPAALLVNRTPPRGHWIGLECVGRRSNRNGLNVQLEVLLGSERRYYENASGMGYLSSSDKRLLIGLGENAVDQILIRWPSGTEQLIESPKPDRYHVVYEGLGNRERTSGE